VDLDPAQTLEEWVECLYQALRYPDEQRVMAYRAGQRYIPATPAERRSAESPGTDRPAGFDRTALRNAPPALRRNLVKDYLQGQFRGILGLELTSADLDRPPQTLGLDSLMGIQLRNRIDADLGLSLSVVDFLKGLSLNQIIDRMVAGLAEMPREEVAPGEPPPVDLTSEKVDQLPEETLDALLGSLLGQGR